MGLALLVQPLLTGLFLSGMPSSIVTDRARIRLSPSMGGAIAYSGLEQTRLKVLYDGCCMICVTNQKMLEWFDKRNNIDFVDIRKKPYEPAKHSGVTFDEAMKHIHVCANCEHPHLSRCQMPIVEPAGD